MGAGIVVRQRATGVIRKVPTRKDGLYHIGNLGRELTRLKRTAREFKTAWRQLRLLVGDHQTVNLNSNH